MASSNLVLRFELPATAERVFDLFTRGDQLTTWFCDQADSDVQPGGRLVATWLDEDGETWARSGTWVELEAPGFARLVWDAEEGPADEWQFGIAGCEGGCRVTVVSPVLPHPNLPNDVRQDAVRQGWERTFAALDQLLRTEA
jgi:uncharacterized protein YndB with AHSA1/START domain